MAKLEFALKKSELEKAFKEQERTGRVVLSIPLSEDSEMQGELYDPYVAAHKHRGELGFAETVSKKKADGRMVDVRYDVRVIAARLTKKAYQIEVRFTESDLFT